MAGPEPLGRLFLRFLRFGALAWGGPVAQIAMVRRELVDEENWVDGPTFNRLLALYQVLPGPEAHELCVHLGMTQRGRLGGLLAGLGFMLPGLVLILLLSWLYVTYGVAGAALGALFAGAQAAVAALVVRAAHHLGTHALHKPGLLGIGAAVAVAALLGLPFWVTLPAAAGAGLLIGRGRTAWAAGLGVLLLVAGAWAAAQANGAGPRVSDPEVSGPDPSQGRVVATGLKAGLLTFGGAYTAIPLVEEEAVGGDGWMTPSEFLDGLALSGIIPAPLIIFGTFVGFLGGGWVGALLLTAGIFLPAFAFALAGQRPLERLLHAPRLHAALDGVTAGVVGLVAVTALALVAAAARDAAAVSFMVLALATLLRWKARMAVPAVVLGCAALGWLAWG